MAEIILGIIAIVISLVSMGVTIWLAFYTNRPRIKVEVKDCIHSLPSKILCVLIEYSNKSSFAGDIKDATLIYNKKKFDCISEIETFDLSSIDLFKNNNFVSGTRFSKRLPITAIPFKSNIAAVRFNVSEITQPIHKAVLKVNFVVGFSKRYTLTPAITVNSNNNKTNYQTRKNDYNGKDTDK